MSAGTPHDDTALTSAQIADLMDVGVSYIYKLRSTDTAFPTPIAYEERSPLYSETAILEYMKARSNRAPSARGRRPRALVDGENADTFAQRLRASIMAGEGKPEIDTQRALIEKLGLNSVTFGNRMRGRNRWKDSELAVISELLRIDTSDANDAVTKARARG
ncbi:MULTISPECIES: DNA-binding protein [unclassified Microbacterium]|uniref:DNA-binding protein n=1 Tax=unclassified Microbacterium TaxID=2609290 RepID=UPI000CFDE0E0|nr:MULTISPECIES: DNA-binding protein [unclassified Microbacterium]PQZ53161.1 DNA-binding protein [Microbacterium sp. MYb43]PQZ74703.1 DNA-binding protein [Microbacterium sp. MYb40]PRB18791.1 DNA-binding protein [Microbacterium sp. MYb54]PRB23651.1 DNA-binding protein [Microbacterium sp. MYb50]PRB63341.1 DNA-binding protein [Microbacterium sp. MYb24]